MDRFEQFKSRFPEFGNLSNGEIVNLVSQYTGADPQRVYSEFGGEQNRSAMGDIGTALKIGVQRLPETVTGLGDVLVAPITGRASISDAADSLGRATGFRPGQWANDSQLNYSPAQQQFLQQGAQTEGFADTAAHYLTNPMRSVVQGVESVPGMALGGVYARGLRGLGGLSNAARFGAGEGGVMAGQAMNQMVEDGVDPRRAAGYAAGVGALGGALGYGGGRLAERLGVVNPDELLGFGGRTALAEGATAPGLGRRVVGGMLSEGAFEEMPQSAMEAVMGNLAAERPWDQDVGKQAAAGLVLGGLMGGVVGVVPPARNPVDPIDLLNRDTAPQSEAAPQFGQSELNFGVTGEEAIGTRGLRNPFDAAGYVSGFQQGQETTVDVPQSDLFGGTNELPPADLPRAPKIDIPVPQPLQNDPVRSAVAQASPATLRKDGTLKDIVEKALGAYSEFSDGEIAAALEEFAASKRKDTVWRVAALEAIARQRAAQGVPNVAQVDAASGQGAGAVPAGSAGNAPSGPVVLDGVRQPAGAPALSSAAGIPVGEPVVQQPSGLTEGARPTNVPPTQQVAAQAQTARGQEGAQVGAEQSRDAERAQVSRIFDTLSEREREILTKYHFDKMTFEEIGSELKERGESGTTRQRIEQQHKDALRKLAEAGRPFGLTPERLRLYFPDESRRMAGGADVQTASAAEVAQSGAGMTYRNESNNGAVNQANDEFEMADAVDGAEALDLDTDIAREEFDEGFRGERGADVDALEQVEAVESMARTERDHAGREITEEAVRIAGLEYDQDLQEGDVPFAQLDRADQIRYTKAAIAFNDEVLSAQQLMRVFGEIADGARQQASQPQRAVEEAGAVAQVQGAVPARDAGETQQETGAREEVTSTNPLEARVAALRELDLGEKQSARLDKLIRRYQNGEIDVERLGEELQAMEEQAFPEDRGGKGMRFSRTTDTKGTTVEAVRSAINDIATPAGNRKITVVQSADELIERGILNSSQARGTQGYVTRKGDAYFIADNIRPGNELAVVLHEIGAHLGIENLLTDKQYETLVKKIFDWAQSDANTQESRIARAAIRRVAQAKIENEADLSPETIAYFIEEAVKAGVNPTAMQYKTELGRWFRTLWAAFKVALDRLGLIDTNKLTAQNVVDLAYGAANLSLSGKLDAALDGETRFSKIDTSTPEGFFDAIRNRTADFFINPVGFMKEHGLGWLTLEQLADVVKSKSVSGYHRVMVAMQQFSKDRVHDAALIDVEWAKLSPNEQSRLSTVMRGATRASYDPENEAPANDEQRTLNDQYEALTPAAKDIYLKVREYYSTNFEERKQILLDAANRAKAAGKNTSEVERMFAKVKGPYFPLMRIGGWYSVGMSPELAELMDKKERNEASAAELKRIETLRKDAKHYVSRGHTTRRAAELSRRELQAQLGVAYANRAEERIGQEVAQLPDMAKLEEYLAPHLPVGVRSQVRDMLAQAYFDALPEKSALKRQLKREGVHGEEEDMRRVFAASALSSAHHISRLKYANDLSEAMVKVRAEGRRDETLRMVGNELNKRTALALETQENPIVDRVLQVSYFANLGLSPAFLLTNMTQVPMITAPWLGARHGFAKATRALAEAFTDTKDMVRATYAGKGVKDGWRSEFDWSQKYPEGTDEHKLFRELLDRNLLDITMEHDLTAVAEVRNTKIDDAIKIANLPVRVTETVNRSITGLAAYRLARADGKSHEQAVEHAAKALSETQLNYSGLNTARHMQVVLGSKALARLMMQFRKFQQGMVYLIVKNAYDAYKGETKEDRRIARRTLAGVFGTTGLMAGTLGLPFAGTVAAVVGAVGGMLDDDDEPFDPVVEYRNFLTDMFGPEMAAVLAKGLPTLMNVDLSKRVGMGDIGTPLPFMRQGRTGTEAVNNTLGAAAGAWAGTTASMLDGIAFLANGDYAKAAEKIIPIKAAQNLVRGYRYDDQGLTNRNGELVVPAEKFSAWDIALRTAGFQPMREAEYYEANQAVEGAKRAAQDTRTKLLRQYAQAKLRGEPTADVDAEIKAFNERHPQKGLRIDYSARARAVQARRKMADERNEAGVRVDRTGALFEDRGRFAAP